MNIVRFASARIDVTIETYRLPMFRALSFVFLRCWSFFVVLEVVSRGHGCSMRIGAQVNPFYMPHAFHVA